VVKRKSKGGKKPVDVMHFFKGIVKGTKTVKTLDEQVQDRINELSRLKSEFTKQKRMLDYEKRHGKQFLFRTEAEISKLNSDLIALKDQQNQIAEQRRKTEEKEHLLKQKKDSYFNEIKRIQKTKTTVKKELSDIGIANLLELENATTKKLKDIEKNLVKINNQVKSMDNIEAKYLVTGNKLTARLNKRKKELHDKKEQIKNVIKKISTFERTIKNLLKKK